MSAEPLIGETEYFPGVGRIPNRAATTARHAACNFFLVNGGAAAARQPPDAAERRAKEDHMPQQAWNDKDERQYEHVKKSEMESGRSEDRAEEIAARTVNKQRREEGRTESKRSSGTGNPNSRLESRSVDELRNRAAEIGIEGRSSMKKDELVDAIRRRN